MERIEFDHSKLLGRIIERFGTRAKFAVAAGYSESALSARYNNSTPFDSHDIELLCKPELLDIPADQIGAYFFTPKVR